MAQLNFSGTGRRRLATAQSFFCSVPFATAQQQADSRWRIGQGPGALMIIATGRRGQQNPAFIVPLRYRCGSRIASHTRPGR